MPQSSPRFLAAVRFVVDDHLGRLARWLRTLGHDTLWIRSGSEARIVEASAEGRIFVTRDSAWLEKTLPGRKVVVTESRPLAQLGEVAASCALSTRRQDLFTRCSVCNAPTHEIAKQEIEDRLPPHIRKTRRHFRLCARCRRIYWSGTHVDAMITRLQSAGLLQ